MLTMLLGGLGHGASWTFVVWGALHGTFLCAERWVRGWACPSAVHLAAGNSLPLLVWMQRTVRDCVPPTLVSALAQETEQSL